VEVGKSKRPISGSAKACAPERLDKSERERQIKAIDEVVRHYCHGSEGAGQMLDE